MEEVGKVILEALKESLISLPFLLVIYFLMELLEHKREVQFEKFVAKSKKTGPLWGAIIGCIPQCAFSAVMADLFSKRMITIGTLLAVFIATSDEAIVVLLSTPSKFVNVLALIAIKIVIALIVGFAVDLIVRNQEIKEDNIHHNSHYDHEHTHHHKHNHNEKQENVNVGTIKNNQEINQNVEKLEDNEVDKQVELSSNKMQNVCPCASCDHCETCEKEEKNCLECEHNKLHHKHELEEHSHNGKKEVLEIFLEALKHTLVIFAWILGANLLIGILVEVVGLENLKGVLLSGTILEPIILTLFGLIPNCGASVAIVNLYLNGIVSFGSCVGALCTGAGLGLIILFKNNKNIKQNLLITLFLYAIGVLSGFIINLIPLGL